jgi:hypothetical protein
MFCFIIGPLLLLEEEEDDIEHLSEEQGLYALEPDVMSVHKLLSIEEYSLKAMEHSLDHLRINGGINKRKTPCAHVSSISIQANSKAKTPTAAVRGPGSSSFRTGNVLAINSSILAGDKSILAVEKSNLAVDCSVLNKVLFALINHYQEHPLHVLQVIFMEKFIFLFM